MLKTKKKTEYERLVLVRCISCLKVINFESSYPSRLLGWRNEVSGWKEMFEDTHLCENCYTKMLKQPK